jgi:hypothetical protein
VVSILFEFFFLFIKLVVFLIFLKGCTVFDLQNKNKIRPVIAIPPKHEPIAIKIISTVLNPVSFGILKYIVVVGGNSVVETFAVVSEEEKEEFKVFKIETDDKSIKLVLESVDKFSLESVVEWVLESEDQRVIESVDQRVLESVDKFSLESVVEWVLESEDQRVIESVDQRVLESLIESEDQRVLESVIE